MSMTAKEISQLLSQRAYDFAKSLFPNAKQIGNELCIGNLNGDPGNSLKIHVGESKKGIWSDFATGQSGDLLDLICLKRNITLSDAISEARCYLGISLPSFEAHKVKAYQKPAIQKTSGLAVGSPVWKYLTEERRLSPDILQKFKISERGREIVFPYYQDGELINVKYLSLDRSNGKKQIRAEANCKPILFGFQSFETNTRAREVCICEGEIDAMTLSQYGIPSLSVPFGGGKGAKQAWIEHEFVFLSAFDQIFLCFDPDAEGRIPLISAYAIVILSIS